MDEKKKEQEKLKFLLRFLGLMLWAPMESLLVWFGWKKQKGAAGSTAQGEGHPEPKPKG